jgi:hypothetical protein
VGIKDGTGIIACSKSAGRGKRREAGRDVAGLRDKPLVSASDLLSTISKI